MVLAELGQGWQGFPLQQIKASGEAGEAGGVAPWQACVALTLSGYGIPCSSPPSGSVFHLPT